MNLFIKIISVPPLPKLMSGELKVTNMDLVNEMLDKGIR